MSRKPQFVVPLLVVLAHATFVLGANAAVPGRALVLPLRTLGVDEATAVVSHDLLVGSLEDLGMMVVRHDAGLAPPPSGEAACDAVACAAELGREHGADLVVFGSLSRLGGKIIARVNVLRVGEEAPWYRDQLTAAADDDLDTVMRRFAEGITSGRPNSDRATVESVTLVETEQPARRATRSGSGVRAGVLFPTGGGFGGTDRLTSLRLSHRYELRDFQIETTPVLGFMWGDGNFDWTLLDLGVSRIFGTGDMATYLGMSVGIHSVTVEEKRTVVYTTPGFPTYSYDVGVSHTETAPTVSVSAGLLALRTYDFTAVLELRYYYVFESFEQAGGGGAQGLLLSFGTNRSGDSKSRR